VCVCVYWQLKEKYLQQRIELLRTQEKEAELYVERCEEELKQKGEFVHTQQWLAVSLYRLNTAALWLAAIVLWLDVTLHITQCYIVIGCRHIVLQYSTWLV